MRCLLCNSDKVKVLESHDMSFLKKMWKSTVVVDDELFLENLLLYGCTNCTLTFFDPRLAGGDLFYSELGKLDWYYLHDGKTEYDYVQKYIQKGDDILDIGSGRGVLYSKIKCEVNYTGLELSSKAVELANKDNINVVQETLEKHSEKNKGKYDVVSLFQVLEHLTELQEFLQHVKSTLKEGGVFVIAVPNNDGFLSYTPNYMYNLPPHHTILWKESSLKFLAKKYDFEIVDIHRENLQDVHRKHAYLSYFLFRIKRLLFKPILLIDDSDFFSNTWNKLADRWQYQRWYRLLILPIIKRKVVHGQSIMITLRKK